jgi:hypothetical protein
MKITSLAAAAFIALGASVALGANADAATSFAYDYTFTGNVSPFGSSDIDPFTVHVVIDETGGNAYRGSGTISGGGLTGTQNLTLISLLSSGVENDGGGMLGYRSNDGTDWFGADTNIPIDGNGLVFAMGPSPGPTVGFGTSQQFDVYTDGGSNFYAGFFGQSSSAAPQYWSYNLPVNATLTVSAIPEPGVWAMMLLGMFGLGTALRGARRKSAGAVAAA